MAAAEPKPFSIGDFSNDQLKLFKEAFSIYAGQINKKADYITVKELPDVMRSVGVLVSFNEVDAYTKEFGVTKQFDFADFLALSARSMKPPDNEETLIAAFRRFDPSGKGTIPVADFKHVMTTIGDVLTNDEIDQFIKEADQGGNINYKEYARRLITEGTDKGLSK